MIEYYSNDTESKAYKKQISTLAKTYAQMDPKAASDWALGQEDSKASGDAVREVVGEWLEQDTLEASVFINELEDGVIRDDAVNQLVQKVKGADPVLGFEYAVTLSNNKLMMQTLENVVKQMYRSGDAKSANSLVKNSDLGEGQKNKLLGLK
jgi:hypothetical protein